MPSNVNPSALIAIGVGGILAYSGLRGKRVSATIRSVITGNNPAATAQAVPIIAAPLAPGDTNSTSVQAGNSAATPGMLAARNAGNRATVIAAAQSQLGKPYIWATPVSFSNPNPASFDCSGLTGWCYAKIGIQLAHYTGTQYAQLNHAPFSQVQPGDLVFYGNLVNIYHVAMYIGNNQIIEAPTEGIPVRVRSIHAGDSDLMQTVGVCPGG
jgi:cell wall-associated NlpC family hydrolase